MSDVIKVTVNLPAEQVAFLQSVAARESMSVTAVLCRAIKAEQFFVDNENVNRKILIEDGDRIREIIRQ